eukprot:3749954-Rhodomonas_salina.1
MLTKSIVCTKFVKMMYSLPSTRQPRSHPSANMRPTTPERECVVTAPECSQASKLLYSLSEYEPFSTSPFSRVN